MNPHRKERLEKITAKGKKHYIIKVSLIFGVTFFMVNWLLDLAMGSSLLNASWKIIVFLLMTVIVSVSGALLSWNAVMQEKKKYDLE